MFSLYTDIYIIQYLSHFYRSITILKKWIFKQISQLKPASTPRVILMQDHLTIICQFADTITNTIKRFAELCREQKRRRDAGASEYAELQNQLIKERKKRIELEELVRRTGNSIEDPSLAEFINNSQERIRPKTAFLLFFAEYRQKVMRQNPTLTLARAAALAKIKWGTLKKQHQEIYQTKLADMNKIYSQKRLSAQNYLNNGDGCLVKREFGAQNGEGKQNQGQNNEEEQDCGTLRKGNGQEDAENDEKNINNYEGNQVQSNKMPSPTEKATPSNNQQAPREKSVLQNILDLFHTQPKHPPQQPEQHQTVMNDMIMASQPMEEEAIVPQTHVENVPQLIMIEPATANNPIIIPPTIQQ